MRLGLYKKEKIQSVDCWINLLGKQLFNVMQTLTVRYL